MRQFVVDELSREELGSIDNYLKRNAKASGLGGIFWLPLPESLLGPSQAGHAACGPFLFAIEVRENSVHFELLVRSQANLHCDCTAYATPEQRDYFLAFIDRLLAEELIRA